MKRIISIVVVGIILTSCFFPRIKPDPPLYTRYEPVFMGRTAFENSLQTQEARSISFTGKIYIWEDYLFINEPNKGVHIFDNTNTESPVAIGFINILGNIDISIKNGLLLADNAIDLVSIDITDINNVRLVKRLENVFPGLTPPDNFFIPAEFLPPNKPDSLIIVDWKIK